MRVLEAAKWSLLSLSLWLQLLLCCSQLPWLPFVSSTKNNLNHTWWKNNNSTTQKLAFFVSSPEFLFTAAGRSISRATSTELLHWKLQSLGSHDHHSTRTVRAFRSLLLGFFTIVLLILAVFRYLSSVLWVEPVARILSLPATDLCTTANLRCVKIAIEYQNFWKRFM